MVLKRESYFHYPVLAALFLSILIFPSGGGTRLQAQTPPPTKATLYAPVPNVPPQILKKVLRDLQQNNPESSFTAAGGPQSLTAIQSAALQASGPDPGDHLGWSIAVSGDTVVVGAYLRDLSTAMIASGAAYIFDRHAGGSNNWGLIKKLTAGDPAADDRFGYAVASDGDTVVVGAYWKELRTGAAYIFDRHAGGSNNWGQVKKLTAGDATAHDWFGYSVAIDGDTMVVGACWKDLSAAVQDSGAAYVFDRHAGGSNNWGQVKKLTAGDPAAHDNFGISVAIAGDAVVVGADSKDFSAAVQDSGATYIFGRDVGGSNNWGQVKKLTAGDPAAHDWFGFSAAIFGNTVVVGAPGKDLSAAVQENGAAYVFERHAGGSNNWGQVKKLTAVDPAAHDGFGISVAIFGNTVLSGADGQDREGGAAYVFERDFGGTDNWGEWGKLIVIESQTGAQFGYSTAINGQLALVGAPYWNSYSIPGSAENTGKACLFFRDPGGANRWRWIKSFFASFTQPDNLFGYSAAVGNEFVFLGAPLEDNAQGQDAGAVYIYHRDQGGPNRWGYFKTLLADDGVALDHFGISQALSGDTLIVGAWWKNWWTGVAYIFQRNQNGADSWGQVRQLKAPDGASLDLFGKSTAISGDVAVVGAYGDDDGGESSGSAYVFERNRGGLNSWGMVRKLTAEDAAPGDEFGWSVGIAGDWVAVGATKDDDRGEDAGAVYLFHRNQGGPNLWGQVKKITVPDGAPGDYFGTSLSINDQFLLVGADWKNLAGEASGAAYLFQRDMGGIDNWGLVNRFQPGNPAAHDQFGYSVALSGDTLLVGAMTKDVGGPEAGAAYVFQVYRALFLPLIFKN